MCVAWPFVQAHTFYYFTFLIVTMNRVFFPESAKFPLRPTLEYLTSSSVFKPIARKFCFASANI